MHPLVAAGLTSRLARSQRIMSAFDAADGALSFTDTDTANATDDPRVFFGWPETPVVTDQIAVANLEKRLELRGNDLSDGGDVFKGGFEIHCFASRAMKCILLAEAVRRELNKRDRAWPLAAPTGSTIVELVAFRVDRIGELVNPSPEDGYQVFRISVSGSTMEQLEEV